MTTRETPSEAVARAARERSEHERDALEAEREAVGS